MTVDRTRSAEEKALHGMLLLTGWRFIPSHEDVEDDFDVYCADGLQYGPAIWEIAFFGKGHDCCATRWRLTYWGPMPDTCRWYSNDPHEIYRIYRQQRARVDAGFPATDYSI